MIRRVVANRLKLVKKNIWDDGGLAKRKAEKKAETAKPEINITEILRNRKKYKPPPPPTTLCSICKEPVYWYEGGETCLWCQKKELDKV